MERADFSKIILALLIAIILLGSFLRLYGIGKDSLWLDEYVSFHIASKESLIDVYSSAMQDNNPPLHYLLIHFMGESEAMLRLPSAIFGIATIPLAYLIGRYYFGELEGLAGAFLLSISYMHIKYSQEARAYTMLCFFAVLSLYFFARAIKENKIFLWLGFILSTSLGIYSHYFTALAVLSYLSIYLVLWKKQSAIDWRRFFFSLIAIAILSIPLTWGFVLTISHKTSPSVKWGESPSLTFIPMIYKNFSAGFLIFPIFILLFALGIWFSKKKNQDEITLLLLYLLVPTMLSLLAAYLIDFSWRYIIFLLPVYLLIISKGIVETCRAFTKQKDEKGRGRRKRAQHIKQSPKMFHATILAVLLIIFASSLPTLLVYELSLYKEDWRGIAALLKNETSEGDCVVILPGYHNGVFGHYYNNSSDGTVLISPANHTPAEMEKLSSGCNKTWYVVDYDIDYVDPNEELTSWFLKNANLEINTKLVKVVSRSKAAP